MIDEVSMQGWTRNVPTEPGWYCYFRPGYTQVDMVRARWGDFEHSFIQVFMEGYSNPLVASELVEYF